jgi:hypothetical protein
VGARPDTLDTPEANVDGVSPEEGGHRPFDGQSLNDHDVATRSAWPDETGMPAVPLLPVRAIDPEKWFSQTASLEGQDPLVVVREHVVPILVDARVIGSTEDVEVVDAVDPPPPTSVAGRAAVQLRISTARTSPSGLHNPPSSAWQPSPDTARGPDVQVHIDRIEVVRPTAPPKRAASARRNTKPADHAAYLTRRRELS